MNTEADIITITACAKLDSDINLSELEPKIHSFFKNSPICEYQISLGHNSKKKNETNIITSTSNTIVSKGSTGLFHNCISLKLTGISVDSNKICIKFFKNRSIHITGLRNNNNTPITDIIETITMSKIINLEYVLIRSKYSLLRKVQLNNLESILNNDSFFIHCSYIPSNYRGLIAKSEIGSVSIFGTGTMLISTKNFDNIDILINRIKLCT